MNQTEFEKLCRQIADVPWVVYEDGMSINATYDDDNYTISKQMASNYTWHLARFAGNGAEMLMDNIDIQMARAFFGDLELRHIAREIAPTAKWELVGNWAHIPGLAVERLPSYFSIEIRDRGGFVASMAENTTAGLIAAYREYRAQHEAARGVKTRQPKPRQPKPAQAQPLWYPPDLDYITIEHARNILACMADPEKYTRIARWAKCNPSQAARIMRTALDIMRTALEVTK